jgi:hypothetical protein
VPVRTIVALGAEKQAASSLALAYPDCTVIFVSDRDIVDGSDLSNVQIRRGTPADPIRLRGTGDRIVPLCPRWLPGYALSRVFDRLERVLPKRCLPLRRQPTDSGEWVVKGNCWRWPDAPIIRNARELTDIIDVHGCGVLFQPYCRAEGTVMAIGRRERAGACVVGIVEVLQERFFRDDILQAAETIEDAEVLRASIEILDTLDHRDYFTLNWLRTDQGLKLTSLRPVPRAVFRSFLSGGIDLLGEVSSTKVAAPGLRFSAYPTYVPYHPRLSA